MVPNFKDDTMVWFEALNTHISNFHQIAEFVVSTLNDTAKSIFSEFSDIFSDFWANLQISKKLKIGPKITLHAFFI